MTSASSDCSYVAYIDEAGDAGSKVGAGSSQFITMAAVILPTWQPDLPSELFGHAHAMRKGQKKGKPFKKFSESTEADNFLLTKLFDVYGIKIVQVAFHKPSMKGLWMREHSRSEYCYLCKVTIERVSWYVKESLAPNDPGNGKCSIVFSENKAFPYKAIDDYFQKLKWGQARYNCRIEWDHIVGNFTTQRHDDESAIHLADIAASALYRACEPSAKNYGMTDDRFERNLLPCLARRPGAVYGFKMFPKEARPTLEAAGELGFLRHL